MKNRKVFKFNELMDPELGIQLGLQNFQKDTDDKNYFFDFKEVNKLWDEDNIKVYVYNVRFDGDSLIFKTKITIYGDEFDIYIHVDYDENVEFGSEEGPEYLDSFEMALDRLDREMKFYMKTGLSTEDELEYFHDMIYDIYDEIIPDDFWDVRSKVN